MRNFTDKGCGNMIYFTCGAIVQKYHIKECHYRRYHCREVLYKDMNRHGCHSGVMSLLNDITINRRMSL